MGTLFGRVAEAARTLSGSKGFAGSVSGNADRAFGLMGGVVSSGRNPPLRRTEDLLEAYRRLPWLRSIVGRIGFAISATTWELFVETQGAVNATIIRYDELMERRDIKIVRNRSIQRSSFAGRRKLVGKRKQLQTVDIIEIQDHPLLALLESFNPMMTGLAGMKLTQHYLDLVGEAFWLKERGPFGEVLALWPLSPVWVRDTPKPSRPTYELQFQGWNATVPESEIVWFCDNDPVRPYSRGIGIASALSDELETDEYAAKHTKREFFNNAVPELLITAEGMGEDETKRMERDWRQKNRGFFKALQVYFMNRKVDVKPLGQTFKSLQLIQLRKWERDIIIEVFGVPPEILGIVNESKRATIDAADFLFSRWVLLPRLELIRSTIQERLVPDFDERLILDFESPVKEDADRQLKAGQIAPWAMQIDEWRGLQGQDPLPDGRGEVHLVPQNLNPMTFGETAEPVIEPVSEPASEEPTGPPVDQEPAPEPEPEPEPEPAARGLRLVYDKAKLEQLERTLDETLLTGS